MGIIGMLSNVRNTTMGWRKPNEVADASQTANNKKRDKNLKISDRHFI